MSKEDPPLEYFRSRYDFAGAPKGTIFTWHEDGFWEGMVDVDDYVLIHPSEIPYFDAFFDEVLDNEWLEPWEDGEWPVEDDLEPRPRHRVVWREDIIPIPDAVYDRSTLLEAVIRRQLDLEDQLILPENEQAFLDEDSGLSITPAYVRAHDNIIDALYEDLAEHGSEGLKHAGDVFAAHHLPLPGWRPRDDPLPFIDEELETERRTSS